ncbi:hypothetical protein [Terriglobus sp.]|uniref:hypothetical protein n=1 Tax=Terriglobus sp. TaxID=1889013 RepID=UPI003B003211
MADRNTEKVGFFASLMALGRSVLDLGRAFGGKDPLPTIGVPAHANAALRTRLPLALPIPEQHSEDAQLLTQHTPGWHVPHPTRLPIPTYAPVMTAFGIVFVALGAVTVWPLSIVGALIFVAGIAKWIGELLHD